jgi:hypothetical protein
MTAYPQTEQRSVDVMHEGQTYTVKGEWDPGARGSNYEPDEPAGFITPKILDENGEDISDTLGDADLYFIIMAAETEIIYGSN